MGKTIQIYLPDGNPKGVKKISITTDKIEIIQVPRAKLSENSKLLDFNGVYILVDSLKQEKPEIYIGKGKVKNRTYSHDSKKDFWNTVFAIRLKDENGFNDAHNSYLEYYFVKRAKDLGLAVMHENRQEPQRPDLAEEILSDLENYIQTIEILFAALGLKCFQLVENSNTKKKDILRCSDRRGNFGEGEYTEEGLLLYKGAVCKLELHKGTERIPMRDEMICSGQLKEENGHYILQENKLFSSVSSAASIILARRANGWSEWKNKRGKTLNDLVRNRP
jgi:hypothetical protein